MEKQMYQQQMAERQRQATIEAQRVAEFKRRQDMVRMLSTSDLVGSNAIL